MTGDEALTKLQELAAGVIESVLEDFSVCLDYSPQSLPRLDRLHPYFIDLKPELRNAYVAALGAYLGEVVIHSLGGEWDFDFWDQTCVRVGECWFFPFKTADEWLKGEKNFSDMYKIVMDPLGNKAQ